MIVAARRTAAVTALLPLAMAIPQATPAFEEITAGSGLDGFVQHYGDPRDKRLILENIGGGVALVDLDGDGRLDAYLPSGQSRLGAHEARNGLFRGARGAAFGRAAAHSGGEPSGWFFGVAAADYDDDGYRDLYVTELGGNRLLRNRGDGSFEDVTGAAGAAVAGFGTGVAWADLDRDGWLDLAVANYVDFDPATVPGPGEAEHCLWKGVAVPCGPRGLGGERAVLLRNRGDGTFTAWHDEVAAPKEFYGLGMVFSDHDADGWIDLYMADDQTPNRLFHNRAGALEEIGLFSGTAYSEDGHAEAGMGVDWVDLDGDGRSELFVTNFADETNTLYRPRGPGDFRDATVAAALAIPSFRSVGWGTGFRDFDGDGALDLFVANGHVYSQVDSEELADEYPQLDQLFLGEGDRFRLWDPPGGDALGVAAVSRGAAFGDVDGDGAVDVLVGTLDGPPRLLRNRFGSPPGSVTVRLRARGGNRAAVGARVVLELPDGTRIQREVQAGHSYLSQSDYDLRFTFDPRLLDRTEGGAVLHVHWPSGPVRPPARVAEVRSGRFYLIDESGTVLVRDHPQPLEPSR